MPFDAKKFKSTKWEPSVQEIEVDELKDFFKDGEKPVWKVRALTGVELARVREAVENNLKLKQQVERLFSKRPQEAADAADKIIMGPDIPSDIARRIEMLILGSVDPKCDLELAKKLCEHKGTLFHSLTNTILQLSGIGSVPGGSKPSGKTKT